MVGRLNPERYRPLALDLPGHGEAGALRPVTLAACVEWVQALSPPRFALAGYSMGGRIALRVALADPARVTRLVLVSTTAGIEDEAARAARRAADEALAARLDHEPFERFVQRWRAQPLFAADPPESTRRRARTSGATTQRAGRRAARDRRRCAAAGVGSPRRAGMPATVLVGERDQRYREIGRRLADALPHGELRVVPGGHTLLLENPVAVAEALGRGVEPAAAGRTGTIAAGTSSPCRTRARGEPGARRSAPVEDPGAPTA